MVPSVTALTPPPGTAPGTVCVLHYIGIKGWRPCDEERRWTGSHWRLYQESFYEAGIVHGATPEEMHTSGWRFVRVVGGKDA